MAVSLVTSSYSSIPERYTPTTRLGNTSVLTTQVRSSQVVNLLGNCFTTEETDDDKAGRIAHDIGIIVCVVSNSAEVPLFVVANTILTSAIGLVLVIVLVLGRKNRISAMLVFVPTMILALAG